MMPHQARSTTFPKSPWAAVPLAIAVFFLSLLVQELVVRFAAPEFDPTRQLSFTAPRDGKPALAYPNRTFHQTSNTGDYDVVVRTNQHGLRDDKNVADAAENDWLIVGDSYVFGWGVDVSRRMSEQIQAMSGRKIFNLAMPGDFDDYDALLHYAAGLGAKTRKVIIGVTMENDLHAYGPPDRAADPVSTVVGDTRLQTAKLWLTRNSELYFLATSLVHHSEIARSVLIRLGLIIPIDRASVPTSVSPDDVASSARRLSEIAASFERAVIVVLPSRNLWIGDAGEQARTAAVHAGFVQALRDAHLEVVDLRPVFEAEGHPMSYFFAHDGHWLPIGHHRAAEVVTAAMSGAHP